MAVGAISGAAASYQASSNIMTGATVTTPATNVSVVSAASEESSSAKTVSKQTTEKKQENNNSGLSMNASSQEITEEKMQKAIDDINRNLQNKECEFGYDEKTNRVTIKIIDKETDEIIRELPPEKTLKMIAKVWELAGLLVDEKL